MSDFIRLEIDNLAYGKVQCDTDWHVEEKGTFFHRIYYVYGGKAVYKDDTVNHELRPGFIYIFPVNKPYTINHDPACPLLCLWFHVTTIPLVISPMICHNVGKDNSFFHLLKALEFEVGENSCEHISELIISQLLESLILMLNDRIGFNILKDERLLKILNYISLHWFEKIYTVDLAKLAGFDHYYFNRLFKRTFGVSPQKYISDYRFDKVGRMLLENTPVTVVAERIGFDDAKAFSRAFRKAKGISPSKYKGSQYLQP